MLKLLVFFVVFGIVFEMNAQKIEHQLDTLIVIDLRIVTDVHDAHYLSKRDIKALQAEDVGQLVQRFAGVTLKSYGGLGGMKTISVRGISGNQTGIVVDGFALQNTQSGQLDLSNIQTENLESVQLTIGGINRYLLPVSAYIGGSTLLFMTCENQFSRPSFQVRTALKAGSYGQFDSFLTLKKNTSRSYFSIMGKFRRAQGNYSYRISNGTQWYEGTRINNDLKEGFGNLGIGIKVGKKGTVRLINQFNHSEKGLPGAIILYNPITNQRLNNTTNQCNLDYTVAAQKVPFRVYTSIRNEVLTYIDSTFLNLNGFLETQFYNSHAISGISFARNWNEPLSQSKDTFDVYISEQKRSKITYFGGVEHAFSSLKMSNLKEGIPTRNQLKGVIGGERNWTKTRVLLQAGGHYYSDPSNELYAGMNRVVLTPYFYLQTDKFAYYIGGLTIWAKRSFRIPTFNEMYYNSFSNVALKPEIANQCNIGTNYHFYVHRNEFKLRFDGYYNLVENKIVTIPTKNLFVWTVQNVGKAQVLGLDFIGSHERRYQQFSVRTDVNYSYQYVVDITDKNSPTYHNQLPYLPQNTLNAIFSLNFKNSGIMLSGIATSARYALNQNTESNRIEGFYVFDAGINHTFKFQKNQTFQLNFTIKNCLNQQYAYVRYYVMPGRNFLISISYAFN